MANGKTELLKSMEQYAKEGGDLTVATLRVRYRVTAKAVQHALVMLADKGVLEVVNKNAKRKRYRLVGEPQTPSEPTRRGRPTNKVSDKQTLSRLRQIRLALDPKGADPFWKKVEADLLAWYKVKAAIK